MCKLDNMHEVHYRYLDAMREGDSEASVAYWAERAEQARREECFCEECLASRG